MLIIGNPYVRAPARAQMHSQQQSVTETALPCRGCLQESEEGLCVVVRFALLGSSPAEKEAW